MTDSTSSVGARASRGASERLTRLSHRYLLPVTGACAATLGFLILLGLRTVEGPAIYSTLLLAGLCALVSSFGFLAWQETVSLPSPPARAGRSPNGAIPSKKTEPQARSHAPAPTVPLSGLGRAAVSAAVRAGDQIWRQWATPRTRPLGVEVAGPVAYSWYIPSKPGTVNPFSQRDEDLLFIDRGRVAPVTAPVTRAGGLTVPAPPLVQRTRNRADRQPRSHPFTETELDALFPPERPARAGSFPAPTVVSPPNHLSDVPPERDHPEVRSPDEVCPSPPPLVPGPPSAGPAPLTASWELPGPEAFAGLSEPAPLFSGLGGMLPTLDAIDHQVYLEAINPLPPHLRSQPIHREKRNEVTRPTSAEPHPHQGFCSMCARKLSDFRSWVECPRCSQAMCRECLSLSFLTGAEGRCFSCHNSPGPHAA